jgi:hypothetical protein
MITWSSEDHQAVLHAGTLSGFISTPARYYAESVKRKCNFLYVPSGIANAAQPNCHFAECLKMNITLSGALQLHLANSLKNVTLIGRGINSPIIQRFFPVW